MNTSLGERIADRVVSFLGSWLFIWIQSCIMLFWILTNSLFAIFHFDIYPFIALNLFMSAEAAFSAPLILMSANRSAARDRIQQQADYHTNLQAKKEIEQLQTSIARIDIQKLDVIINTLTYCIKHRRPYSYVVFTGDATVRCCARCFEESEPKPSILTTTANAKVHGKKSVSKRASR